MWYYADNGQHAGPFDEPALDKLLADGVITPETYIWKQGLPEWAPFRQARPLAVAGMTSAEAAAMTCSMCGKKVGVDNLIDLMGMKVCAACKPMAVQTLREGVTPAMKANSAWNDSGKVVVQNGAVLPARCFKCNHEAAGAPIKRKVYWHPAYLYLLVVLSVIVYVIIAIIARKRATVEIYLCAEHIQRRKYSIIGVWSGFVLGLVLFALGANESMPSLIITASLIMAAALIYGVIGITIQRTVRIKGDTVWMKGAGKEFLASLPPWP